MLHLQELSLGEDKSFSKVETVEIKDIHGLSGIELSSKFPSAQSLLFSNISSMKQWVFNQFEGFPMLHNLTIEHMGSLKRIAFYGISLFQNVNRLSLNNLPVLEQFELHDREQLSAQTTDRGIITMIDIPIVRNVSLGVRFGQYSTLYKYQTLRRGKHVSSVLYDGVLDHMKNCSLYRNEIIEEIV